MKGPPATENGSNMTAPVLTVSELTHRIKDLVEASFSYAWVMGEISNCVRAASGHVYFTLKDENAQLRAVMWRSAAMRVRFDLHDGLQVVAAGPLEVYAARGSYQIVVEQLIPQGIGALELAFRQLQEKLAAEGLFDPARKRQLPRFPRRIALVTSPSGAAVRDMLQVMTRRWPAANIVIVPVAVQGEGAAPKIAAGILAAAAIPNVDVVITGRGGGSLEDLWAFNEEAVARAIAACPVPVVCGVGHEIDVTIADLVADRRALTPSEAAEIVVPNCEEIAAVLLRLRRCLCAALCERAGRARMKLEAVASRRVFTRPMQAIQDMAVRVDELDAVLKRTAARRFRELRDRADRAAGALDALSPLKVLRRGYSITLDRGGTVVRDAASLAPGEEIVSLFEKGRIRSRVEALEPDHRSHAASEQS